MIYELDPRLRRTATAKLDLNVLSDSQVENQNAAAKTIPPSELSIKPSDLAESTSSFLAATASSSKTAVTSTPPTATFSSSQPQISPLQTQAPNVIEEVSPEIALTHACLTGDSYEVARILSLPRPPDVRNRFLYLAAKQGFADIAGMLLRSGAEVNAKSPKSGSTPLFLAAERGHAMVAKVLLQWGADPDVANIKSDTPLIAAIRGGHTGVVKYLLMFGVNPIPNAIPRLRPNTRYLLPIQVARNANNTEIEDALFAMNREMDDYLLHLVQSTLTPETVLVQPGHPPATKMSIAPQSLSFIPVQIVSNSHSMTSQPLQLAFNTPPCYSDHFSRLAVRASDPAMDELILLYVACVDLNEGRIVRPRCVHSMPIYTAAFFNGSHSPATCITPIRESKTNEESPLMDFDEQPGFRIFILGNRLNNGGLNSISLHADTSEGAVKDNEAYRRFQKLLIGVFRVRVLPFVFEES